jgi:trk system potassium uptake protein TrkA
MYVIVVGMGEVGKQITRELEAEDHEVVAIDSRAEAIKAIEDSLDVATLKGYGASPEILRTAGASRADLLVAVTDNDEVNLVAAMVGKDLGASRTIARLQGREFDHGDAGVHYDMLGIDMIVNPLILVAQELTEIARSHGANDVQGLAANRVELVQVELPARSKVLHKPLAKLSLPADCLVAAVVRDRELFVPGGSDVLLPGDRVYVIGQSGHMEHVEDMLTGGHEATRVCIVGGGVVGEVLARNLAAQDVEVLLIEKNLDKARMLGEELPNVTVVQGDGTNLGLLEEENVGKFDLLCAVSHEDEVNLMSGLLAKQVGTEKVAVLVHRRQYQVIYGQLGIDIVLSPRQVASDLILRHVRQAELKSLKVLEDGQAEVLELVANEGTRILGSAIKRLGIPRGAILGAILRGDDVIIPSGDDEVKAGDTVVVLTTRAARPRIERLFKPRAL